MGIFEATVALNLHAGAATINEFLQKMAKSKEKRKKNKKLGVSSSPSSASLRKS
jgi:hypothetical protein